MSNDVTSTRNLLVTLVLLLVILAMIGGDLVTDYLAGTSVSHLMIEFSVMILCAVGAGLLIREFARARAAVTALQRDIVAVQEEADRWRSETQEVLEGLGAAIDNQFRRWALTAAEREIGLLLLKGLSHREIGRIRRTSERTVREQARSIYSKAGLSGRSGLSAFFLEDLLLPVASVEGGD
jgi:DNA-binding CsgD family transcriptional regulator